MSIVESKFHFLCKGNKRYEINVSQGQVTLVWTLERWRCQSYWCTGIPVQESTVRYYFSQFKEACEAFDSHGDTGILFAAISDFVGQSRYAGRTEAGIDGDDKSFYLQKLSECLDNEFFSECPEGKQWREAEDRRMSLLQGVPWITMWCGFDWQGDRRWRDVDSDRKDLPYSDYKLVCEGLRRRVRGICETWQDGVWGSDTVAMDTAAAEVPRVYQEILRHIQESETNSLKLLLVGLRDRYQDELMPESESLLSEHLEEKAKGRRPSKASTKARDQAMQARADEVKRRHPKKTKKLIASIIAPEFHTTAANAERIIKIPK